MTEQERAEFNQKYPKIGEALKDSDHFPEHLYHGFERIVHQIEETWGTKAGEAYLDDLLMSSRPNRVGFPGQIATELFRIRTIHGEMFPDVSENPYDPFSKHSRF